jgi:hypothetical protein
MPPLRAMAPITLNASPNRNYTRRNTMKTKTFFAATTLCAAAMLGGVTFAQAQQVVYEPAPTVYAQSPTVVYMQAPVVNIGNRHGNLRNAQANIVDAYQRIDRAQAANDGRLGGHAQRAKELLIQADIELRLAANVANAEGR